MNQRNSTDGGARATGTPGGLLVVVMGVSGSGKSTVARRLAERLDAAFADADDLHPPENVRKMERGEPLDDDDRGPWLDAVRDHGRELVRCHPMSIIACSALKRSHRRVIDAAGNVRYLFLEGSRELIAERLDARDDHFMPSDLLDSQFAALEPPHDESHVIALRIDREPDEIVDAAIIALGLPLPTVHGSPS